ncbi:MAG: class I SAM-dependent methyltransferase [Bacteroidota bacterium]
MITTIPMKQACTLFNMPVDTPIVTTDALATPEQDAKILYAFVAHLKPKHLLEIGTFYGHTTYGFALNSPESVIYTIDIHAGMQIPVPGFQQRELLTQADVGMLFKEKKTNIRQRFGDSRLIETYDDIPAIDFAYIDGNHTHDAIITDSTHVLSLMNNNGVIFWHDYKDDGHVETKQALEDLSKKTGLTIFHIEDSWLAFAKTGNV